MVKGYTLSRLATLDADDTEAFEKLSSVLLAIDPGLKLVHSDEVGKNSLEEMKEFYYKQYGKPGTKEFYQKLDEINNE